MPPGDDRAEPPDKFGVQPVSDSAEYLGRPLPKYEDDDGNPVDDCAPDLFEGH